MTKPKRRPNPDPIKALLKRHPGPWKVHEGVTYKWLVRSRANVSSVVAVTDHITIARAIAALGNGRKP